MYIYHYYDRDLGPFKNISELPDEEAEKIMQRLKAEKSNAFCNQRNEEYLEKRRYYEDILRREFLKKRRNNYKADSAIYGRGGMSFFIILV